MKPCRVCGETKPLSEFHVDPRCADGHKGLCKPCQHTTRSVSVSSHRAACARRPRKTHGYHGIPNAEREAETDAMLRANRERAQS